MFNNNIFISDPNTELGKSFKYFINVINGLYGNNAALIYGKNLHHQLVDINDDVFSFAETLVSNFEVMYGLNSGSNRYHEEWVFTVVNMSITFCHDWLLKAYKDAVSFYFFIFFLTRN